jgi:SPP1 family predicted phage head-tail adaptor
MRHTIDLLQPNTQRDSNSEFLYPVVFATCWASIQALASKYTEKQEQVVTEATHKVVIQYRSGVTSAMKVRFEGRIFDIQAVLDPDETHDQLWLMCYERSG